MKKCNDCNVEMMEATNLHTDLVGAGSMEKQVFIEYNDEIYGHKGVFGNKKYSKRKVKARVCPNCGKVELYVDLENEKY